MIHTISSLKLPSQHPMRRDPRPGTTILEDTFWDHYDTDTLIYDCVHDPKTRKLHVFCPSVLNLLPLFQEARFDLDGSPLGPFKFVKSRHHDCLVFDNVTTAQNLRCRIAGQDAQLNVNTVDDSLQGLNVVYSMIKNEELEWLKDWANFHVRQHGAEAIVLSDNGSDRYSTADIDAALREVDGLKAVHIISTPLRHGPKPQHCTNRSTHKFLQATMMNVVRFRFCANAAAMLIVDTDELVIGRKGESIFEATRKSLFGYIAFNGVWRYATQTDGLVRHKNHTLVNPQEGPCLVKYCVRPNSFVARHAPLQVHNVRFKHRDKFVRNNRFTFLHCRNISTSWKYDRNTQNLTGLQHDDLAARHLSAAFEGDGHR